MREQNYRTIALEAIRAGWMPTQAYDLSGRPLWAYPGEDGLMPLDLFAGQRNERTAA